MAKTKLDLLKRKPVEIRANGITYRGILLEATDTEVTLKTNSRYISIAMDRISSVVDPAHRMMRSDAKHIDSSFYDADLPAESPKPDDSEKK